MKSLGYGLIAVGCLVGSYLLVLDERAVAWEAFVPVLLFAVAGVAMVRVAFYRESQHEESRSENIDTVRSSLERLSDRARRLDDEKEAIDVYDLRHRIDDDFRPDLGPEGLASGRF